MPNITPSTATTAAAEHRRLWRAAIKLPMYTVAVTPVAVGTAAAYFVVGLIDWRVLLAFVTATVGIVAWLNISNDVYDADTGIDQNKRESLVALMGRQNLRRLHILALALLAAALITLTTHTAFRKTAVPDYTVIRLIAVAVLLGYAYQGPPFRLGYYGLGEPITLAGWSLGVVAVYYSQLPTHLLPPTEIGLPLIRSALADSASPLAFAAALVSFPTALILLCSHFHQIDDDLRAGKKSPVVRMGTRRASNAVVAACVALQLAPMLGVMMHRLPIAVAVCLLGSVSPTVSLAEFVRKNHAAKEKIRFAKFYAVKLHFIHGMLLSLGFVLARAIQ